jgi:hypothetical protein
MALKDIELRKAKPRETLYRLADGDALSLQGRFSTNVE